MISSGPTAAKIRSVLRLWALALALSAMLVAAGQRWPAPLAADAGLALGLVLGVPLVMGLVVLSRWRLPSVAADPTADPQG